MDVLIIGGTRFLGPLLVFRLLAGGHRVTVLNRGSRPAAFGALTRRVESLVADRQTEAFAKVLGERSFDAVIDLAAYEDTDVLGAIEVLRGRCGHYIFISTGQVYLVREDCPVPARESDYAGPVRMRPTEPDDIASWQYGMGKRACEDVLAHAWATDSFPATRLRIPMVNGERDDRQRIQGYLLRMLDGGPVLLPDGGEQRTRHAYGAEVARAVTALLGRKETFGEAYNVCQVETPTLGELLATVAEIAGANPRFVSVPPAAIAAAGIEVRDVSPFSTRWMSFLDPGKIERVLGFRHAPLREYLTSIVTSFFAHPPAELPESYAKRDAEIQLATGAAQAS